jgi:hypothetical protein
MYGGRKTMNRLKRKLRRWLNDEDEIKLAQILKNIHLFT